MRSKFYNSLVGTFILLLIVNNSYGQIQEYYRVSNINQLGLMVWNYGLLGNGWNPIDGQILPSCQYRQYPSTVFEQVEHFDNAGLWVGGIVNGEKRVSTAIVDGVFELGQPGFEFSSTFDLMIRSTLPTSPFYDVNAVSHQDLISTYNDLETIPNHIPLGISVHQEVYLWDYPLAESFAIINYSITNVSTDSIHDLYVGLWVDPAIANMNYTNVYQPGGGFTWYDNLNGFNNEIAYQYDADGDFGWSQSYLGIKLLGTNAPTDTWSPHYSQWEWSSPFNLDYPGYVMALNDTERYEQLGSDVPQGFGGLYDFLGYPNQPNNWLLLLSGGPFGSRLVTSDTTTWILAPQESINVYIAVICARWSDNNYGQQYLNAHANIAQVLFNGEDINGNGRLDPWEDTNGNNQIDRFRLPPGAPQNLTAEWDYPQVTLSWDSLQEDIIGYNIYKSQYYHNYSKINQLALTDTTYLDTAVADSGITAYYVVAKNDWGAEGVHSGTVRDRSQPPELSFVFTSNPIGSPNDTFFTFTTRTFTWIAEDPDGQDQIAELYYSLDDTTHWINLAPQLQYKTLQNLSTGSHRFFLKAVDQSGTVSNTLSFPDTSSSQDPGVWFVKEPRGNVLLVDDFYMDSNNSTLSWYQSILDTVIGYNNYSIWELNNYIPLFKQDITTTLGFFDAVVWFTAYTGEELYHETNQAIHDYIMSGGNIFINAVDKINTSFDWFPIDSLFIINPNGRFFPGKQINSQIRPELDLEVSRVIAVRFRGFENFMLNSDTCPYYTSLYKLQSPEGDDSWTGNPDVAGMYQFDTVTGQCSGKSILMSIPLYDGYGPLLDGNGSAGKFIDYIFEEEFLVIEDKTSERPLTFTLQQNYPNPFNPVTTIRYKLAEQTHIRLVVYDLLGREVAVLADGFQGLGVWEIKWDATNAASGIYFYQLQTAKQTVSRKLVVLK